MATKTIGDLPTQSALSGSEVFPLQAIDGITAKATAAVIKTYIAALPAAGGTISGNLTVTGTTTMTGNATAAGTFRVTGNISNSGTPSATMTTGFVHIPKVSGTISVVPTAVTNYAPMYFDSTNNKFYIYNTATPAGWKSITLA
jgi:hypothetical protein